MRVGLRMTHMAQQRRGPKVRALYNKTKQG